ncbi:MAG: FAD-binding oxidoreductase [Myxococcota bacterium]|nr:FAD-binding oxidoreductase [Myxococcota bacterium]
MSESLWLREAPSARWPDASSDRCELLVIGAGLAGCSAALHAQARGVDVLVVERDGPGRGASGRNAGFVLAAHVFEYPDIRARIGADGARDLMTLSRRNHARLKERFAAAADHAPSGAAMLSMDGDAEEARVLSEAADLLAQDGVRCHFTAPHPALRGFASQLVLPGDAQLHPARLVRAMSAEIRRGVRGRVDALEDGVARVGAAEVAFERALICTNAHAAELVPALSGVVTPQRAQMLATAPVAPTLEMPMYANWGYDYFRQRADGAVLVGGRRHLFRDDEATDSLAPSDAVQAALEAYLEAHLPFAAGAPITDRWAGTMGFSPDELPLLGPAPGLPDRVHVLAGFTGHGLGLATALAELAVDLLTGAASADDARMARLFDPAR